MALKGAVKKQARRFGRCIGAFLLLSSQALGVSPVLGAKARVGAERVGELIPEAEMVAEMVSPT